MSDAHSTTLAWVRGHIELFEEVLSRQGTDRAAKYRAAAALCRELARRAASADAAGWEAEAQGYEREASAALIRTGAEEGAH